MLTELEKFIGRIMYGKEDNTNDKNKQEPKTQV